MTPLLRAAGERRTHGMTLVELLVVIAIIGVLVSLLVPAVQSAREAARRVQCANHLRQLALGTSTHVEAIGHFPTGGWGYGWVGDPDCGFGMQQPGGWIYNILPYIEQVSLYQLPADGTNAAMVSKDNAQQRAGARLVARTPLGLFNCPTRRGAILYPKPANGTIIAYNAENNAADDNMVARTDYAMNAGDRAVWYPQGALPPASAEDLIVRTGISFLHSQIPPASIRDGLSNTIMVGERYLNPDFYATGFSGGDNESWATGFNNDLYRLGLTPPMQDRPGYGDDIRFGSAHAGSFFVAFCDGSVRGLVYSIDPVAFQNLTNRNDGATVDGNAF